MSGMKKWDNRNYKKNDSKDNLLSSHGGRFGYM